MSDSENVQGTRNSDWTTDSTTGRRGASVQPEPAPAFRTLDDLFSSEDDDASEDDTSSRRDTLSTLVMSEASCGSSSSSSSKSEEDEDDDDGGSDDSSGTSTSSASSSSSSTSSFSLSEDSSSVSRRQPPSARRTTRRHPSEKNPTPSLPPPPVRVAQSPPARTLRRSPTKRHNFDSPLYRADPFFDPEDVAIVRSSPTSRSPPTPSTSTAPTSPLAAPPPSTVLNPPVPVCLSQLIASSPARKTPRKGRPTDTFKFISRSTHPLASSSFIPTTESSREQQPKPTTPTTTPPLFFQPSASSPPSSTDHPRKERSDRRKSGKCCLLPPSPLADEVIELDSESDIGTPRPATKVQRPSQPKVTKRRIVLSESEDEVEDSLKTMTTAEDSPRIVPSPHRSTNAAPSTEIIDLLSSDEEEFPDPSRLLSGRSLVGGVDRGKDVVDDEVVPETDEENDGVLHWSPPPRPRPTPKKKPVLQPTFRQVEAVDLPDSPFVAGPSSPPKPKIKTKRPPTSKNPPSSSDVAPNVNSKAWKLRRQTLALDLIHELDSTVFDRLIVPSLHLTSTEDPGTGKTATPMGVKWTGRLKTTAGMSRWTRKKTSSGWEHHCGIELSTKVLDAEEKIRNTTAHEMCHLAVWIQYGKDAAPHGKEFKSFGKKVMRARPDISVTTKHDYEIVRKFTWTCTQCPAKYGRDTKSIDVNKHACGRCSSKLVADFATPSTPSQPNAYQQFIKDNYSLVQASSPGLSAPEVMRLVAVRYRAHKAAIADKTGAGGGSGVDELVDSVGKIGL